VKADPHIPCRSPATTLPFSGSAVSFVKVPYNNNNNNNNNNILLTAIGLSPGGSVI
jgi:hypothetical protein